MMAHTEWTLRALDGLGLPMTTRLREALTLHGLVLTVALSLADEVEAEQETGVTLDRWRLAQRKRVDQTLDSGQIPTAVDDPERDGVGPGWTVRVRPRPPSRWFRRPGEGCCPSAVMRARRTVV